METSLFFLKRLAHIFLFTQNHCRKVFKTEQVERCMGELNTDLGFESHVFLSSIIAAYT